MDRRRFLLTSVAGGLAAPLAAGAQQPRKVARIGIISAGATAPMIGPLIGPEASRVPFTAALLRGLRELGYVYGQDFVTEPRGTEGRTDTIGPIVAELVRLQVDVIVAGGSALDALKQATSTIPVVIPGSSDPVGDGYARTLSKPGGNFTGLSLQIAETTGKRLELLKELVPGAAPVGVLWARPGGLDCHSTTSSWLAPSARHTPRDAPRAGPRGAGGVRARGDALILPRARRDGPLDVSQAPRARESDEAQPHQQQRHRLRRVM